MATQTLITFEQLADLPEQDGIFIRELDEGVLIEMPPPSLAHGTAQGNVYSLFRDCLRRTRADFVISLNAGFRLAPRVARQPDVCLVRRSSLKAMERLRGGWRQGAPDLAVEVVSPYDTAAQVDRKVKQYFDAGATSVWLLFEETRHVLAHRRSGQILQFGPGQSIEEPELLPGCLFPVDEFFEGI